MSILVTDELMPLVLTALQGADDIAIDTETSGLNVRNNVDYLMGVCYDVPGFAGYIPFRNKDFSVSHHWIEPLTEILRTKPLIWHNRKFDYHSFRTLGVDPLTFNGPQYDTLLLAQLINEELYSKELDYLARRYLNATKVDEEDEFYKFGKAFGFENVPSHLAAKRAIDATLTRQLRDVLWPQLEAQELVNVYWDTEAPFSTLLYKLEQRGVGTNPDFCDRKSTLGKARMATITREVKFNPASPNDLGRVLLDELGLPVFAHTKSCEPCKKGSPVGSHEGKASFNKIAMKEYDDILSALDNPLAQRITEYRGWQKAVTSLYDPVLEKVGPDGIIRTDFKQHGTVTGRLSSTDPNLQQVPRGSSKPWNGNAKSAFTSGRDEYILFGWDYSQIELRLAAAYGQEQVLLTEFESESADPFNVLAPIIFGVLTPETRHETKTFVYANLYGAGINKIALQLGRPVTEVEGLYRNYKSGIPGIISISQQVTKLVEQRSYVKYWDGRRRHIRNRREAYKAWNSVCQGGAAQLVKKAMLRCEEFETDDCFMVLTVHDEITFVIRENMIPKYEPLIVEAMTDWPDFGVNLHVEGKEWK